MEIVWCLHSTAVNTCVPAVGPTCAIECAKTWRDEMVLQCWMSAMMAAIIWHNRFLHVYDKAESLSSDSSYTNSIYSNRMTDIPQEILDKEDLFQRQVHYPRTLSDVADSDDFYETRRKKRAYRLSWGTSTINYGCGTSHVIPVAIGSNSIHRLLDQ